MKMQGGVCNDSERSGSFPSIARPANVFFSTCELVLPSSEKEESSSPLISSTPILKITAAQSGLGTEVFSPVSAKGVDPGSVGQRDPEIVTSPRSSAFRVPTAQDASGASPTAWKEELVGEINSKAAVLLNQRIRTLEGSSGSETLLEAAGEAVGAEAVPLLVSSCLNRGRKHLRVPNSPKHPAVKLPERGKLRENRRGEQPLNLARSGKLSGRRTSGSSWTETRLGLRPDAFNSLAEGDHARAAAPSRAGRFSPFFCPTSPGQSPSPQGCTCTAGPARASPVPALSIVPKTHPKPNESSFPSTTEGK